MTHQERSIGYAALSHAIVGFGWWEVFRPLSWISLGVGMSVTFCFAASVYFLHMSLKE